MNPLLPDPALPRDLSALTALQRELASRVIREDRFPDPPRLLGGLDCAAPRRNGKTFLVAAAVVLRAEDLTPVEQVTATLPAPFPYIPGFLSFRELPALLEAAGRLRHVPDLWLVDGAGIAHPRRLGLAAHFGAALDVPSIGVAKSRLVGTYQEPGWERGSASPLWDRGEALGWVLRSRRGVKPLFVSPGHRVSLTGSLLWTLRACGRCRLPEPTRLADRLSKAPG